MRTRMWVLTTIMAGAVSAYGAPAVLTYQGSLVDPDNGAVPSGNYALKFTMYDDPTTGVELWTETDQPVLVFGGLFSTTLGDGTPFGSLFTDHEELWLEVACDLDRDYVFDPEETYSPRGRLTSAAWAMEADRLQGYAADAFQRRVTEAAPAGHFIRAINADGTVETAADQDTHDWPSLTGVPAGFADGTDDVGVQFAQVVTVAKSGGDFTSVQAAIDSITDAAADKPYLVWVAPGVYNETVTMKPFVHLQGAGQDATIITSSVSQDNASSYEIGTIVLSSDVTLRDLTVHNDGPTTINNALLAPAGILRTLVADVTAKAQGVGGWRSSGIAVMDGSVITLLDVTVLSEGAAQNRGLLNQGSTVTLRGGVFLARTNSAYAIYNYGGYAFLEADNVIAISEGSGFAYGLYVAQARSHLRGGSFVARNGSNCSAIYNSGGFVGGAVLEADNVSALAENAGSYGYALHSNNTAHVRGGHYVARGGGNAHGLYVASGAADLSAVGITAEAHGATGNNYGVYNSAGTIRITQSRLAGDDAAVRQQISGALYLGACLIDNAVSSSGGLIKYFQCFDANFDAYP